MAMDYLYINPPYPKHDKRYKHIHERHKHFLEYAKHHFRLYVQLGSGRGSNLTKFAFRKNVLECYQNITGIVGFYVHSGGKREVSLIGAAKSEPCTQLFNRQGRNVLKENAMRMNQGSSADSSSLNKTAEAAAPLPVKQSSTKAEDTQTHRVSMGHRLGNHHPQRDRIRVSNRVHRR